MYQLDPHDSTIQQHPCVVVLDVAGSKEYVIVPAYSVGRQTVEDAITLHTTHGNLPRDAVAVTLDNATAIRFAVKFDAYEAHWMTVSHHRVSYRTLKKARYLGKMNEDAFNKIVASLLDLAETRPEQFSQPLLKRLKRMVRQL